MTTTTETPASGRSALERWSALGGALYVVLFIAGILLVDNGAPDFDAAPDEVSAYWSVGSHRDRAALGWALVVLGVFFLIWFLSALRQRIRLRDGDGFLSTVFLIGGAAYAATTLAGISLEAGVLTMSDDTYKGQVYPELVHAARDAGYVMHTAGGAAIGALIIAASVAALRARSVPTWAAWLSVVAGVVALFSVFFIPLFVIALWLLIVSIGLFVRDGRSVTST